MVICHGRLRATRSVTMMVSNVNMLIYMLRYNGYHCLVSFYSLSVIVSLSTAYYLLIHSQHVLLTIIVD